MFKALLVIGILLIPNVARAECNSTLKSFIEFIEKIGGRLANLSTSDQSKFIAKVGKPEFDEPYEIKLSFIGDSGILIVIKDNCVMAHSPGFSVEKFYEFLGDTNT